MAKHLIFAPFEKVILDAQNTPSLISLIQNVSIAAPPGETVPQNAMAPKEWVVATVWELTDAERKSELKQILEVADPTGSVIIRNDLKFKTLSSRHQNFVNMFGFPVGRHGVYTITAWLERDGTKTSDVLQYSFTVTQETRQ